jgi:iron complex transport system ATP-binding protein
MTSLFQLQNASFAYGDTTILQNLSCTLADNTFYGLVGPNGSGKSTLLDLLSGNQEATGKINFRNRPLSAYSHRQLAREIALVPQEFSINFDFTVLEVVMMGRHPHIPRFANPNDNDRQIVKKVMAELGITSLADRLLTRLSGGEKQRVIVARAMAQDTPVLILDEATASLDIHHSIKILQTAKKRVTSHNGTVIAAIHDLNLAAAYCDTIIMLNQGELLKIGTPEETLTPELICQIFGVESQPYFDDFAGVRQVAFRY